MPELAEVTLSTEIIRPLVINKIISKAYPSSTGRYSNVEIEGLNIFNKYSNLEVTNVCNRGKFMYWIFKDPFFSMFCQFGMTGQWSPIQGKHPCFIFEFMNNTKLYFNDPRHFGSIRFTNNYQDLVIKLNTLGWEPFQDKLEDWLPYLYSKLSSDKTIAELLMDQTVFSGVGNYVKCDSLYLAKISPWRKGNSLSREEIQNLCNSIIDVCRTSYNHQGATISTFKDPFGNEGKYSSFFRVYGRKTDSFGNKVIKETTPDKRTTHWCSIIQK